MLIRCGEVLTERQDSRRITTIDIGQGCISGRQGKAVDSARLNFLRGLEKIGGGGSSDISFERIGRIGLRISIQDQNAATGFRQVPREMHGHGRLADAALLIVDHDRLHATGPRTG